MWFIQQAFSFAEDLVIYVLQRYRSEKFKPETPSDYRLALMVDSFRANEPEDCKGSFGNVQIAVVALQPYFEKKLDHYDEVKLAACERNPGCFNTLKFLELCSLVTLKMADDFFNQKDKSAFEYAKLAIVKSLMRYKANNSFDPHRFWVKLQATADSLLMFMRRVKDTKEFVPKCLPPNPSESPDADLQKKNPSPYVWDRLTGPHGGFFEPSMVEPNFGCPPLIGSPNTALQQNLPAGTFYQQPEPQSLFLGPNITTGIPFGSFINPYVR